MKTFFVILVSLVGLLSSFLCFLVFFQYGLIIFILYVFLPVSIAWFHKEEFV